MHYRNFLLTAFVLLAIFAAIGPAFSKEYKGHKFKGTIESVGNGRLSLRDEDQELIEFLVSDRTDVTREEKPASVDDLQTDDVAVVTATSQAGQMIALRIFAMEPQ